MTLELCSPSGPFFWMFHGHCFEALYLQSEAVTKPTRHSSALRTVICGNNKKDRTSGSEEEPSTALASRTFCEGGHVWGVLSHVTALVMCGRPFCEPHATEERNRTLRSESTTQLAAAVLTEQVLNFSDVKN